MSSVPPQTDAVRRDSSPPKERVAEVPGDVERSVVRLLAVAATELARSPSLPKSEALRFSAAEARFRAILQLHGDIRSRPGQVPACPSVRLGSDSMISLVEMFVSLCPEWGHHAPPPWTVDARLVERAKELLLGQDWHLPD
jgi:hypothetical protein